MSELAPFLDQPAASMFLGALCGAVRGSTFADKIVDIQTRGIARDCEHIVDSAVTHLDGEVTW